MMESLTMNKKKLIAVIAGLIACISLGIISLYIQKQRKVDQAVKMYQEFIEEE